MLFKVVVQETGLSFLEGGYSFGGAGGLDSLEATAPIAYCNVKGRRRKGKLRGGETGSRVI